jgi:hypothetical protein
MDMDQLGGELVRLGCGARRCGRYGFIFEPQHSGGVNIEGGHLHFWDGHANSGIELDTARRVLASLPDNAGYAKLCGVLEDLALEVENGRC